MTLASTASILGGSTTLDLLYKLLNAIRQHAGRRDMTGGMFVVTNP